MSVQHSPAPWKADRYYIKSHGGRMIADIAYTGPHHTPQDEYPKSCRLVDEANAKLISSAPELLEALQFSRALIGAMPVEQINRAHKRSAIKLTTDKSPRDYLTEIINKATGKDTE